MILRSLEQEASSRILRNTRSMSPVLKGEFLRDGSLPRVP